MLLYIVSVLTRPRHCRTNSGNAALELAQGVPRAQRKKKTLCNIRTFLFNTNQKFYWLWHL